ncbi:MAG: archaellin/type IV pilin N-terminal domain-containing protein [Candidatus Nanohaloarchaea archaeon]
MKRKGISPLIAAVLLIAFTMAVASLFAQWAPQLIKSAQGDTKNQSQQIQRCSGLIIEFQSGGDGSATLMQTAGEEAVGNVSVTWFYDGGTVTQDYVDFTNNRDVVTASATGQGSTPDEIRASPVNCQGAGEATYTP